MKITRKLLGAALFICAANYLQAQSRPTIDTISLTPSLRQVCKLTPLMYVSKADTKKPALAISYGFSAAEVGKIYPALIRRTAAGNTNSKNKQKQYPSGEVQLNKLVPMLVKSIQEQEIEILALRAMVENLEIHQWEKPGL